MTGNPDFNELVGDEGSPEELERLRRVHELLVAAGPPAELSPALARPPAVDEGKLLAFPRRRWTAYGIAASLAAAAFLIGYVVADRHTAFDAARSIPMHGVAQLASARATLQIGKQDSAGNYPIQMTVRGLERLPNGGWYELLLSKKGRPTLSCGDFRSGAQSQTLRLSIPYDLSGFPRLFDGWVVTVHRPGVKTAPVVMTT